jgi:hypothetical protein
MLIFIFIVCFTCVYFVVRDLSKRVSAGWKAGAPDPLASLDTSAGPRQAAPMAGKSAPGWYPDPDGRYPRRYFDGSGWTNRVSAGLGMPEHIDATFEGITHG